MNATAAAAKTPFIALFFDILIKHLKQIASIQQADFRVHVAIFKQSLSSFISVESQEYYGLLAEKKIECITEVLITIENKDLFIKR